MKFIGKFMQSTLWAFSLLFYTCFLSTHAYADQKDSLQSQTALFDNFPRVALLVKEQYVEPERINPDAMLASILEKLQEMITKLVVTLPPSLERLLDDAKNTKGVHNSAESAAQTKIEPLNDEANKLKVPPLPSPPETEEQNKKVVPEKLIFNLGNTQKIFEYESQRSIWGMIFTLRDIFRFLELESTKQDLAELTKTGKQPIDWRKIGYASINAMLNRLDPHSILLEPKYARELTLTNKGHFGGVGIVISVRDGFLTVISPIDGTPAAIAGVKAKDRIIKIDDESAINMDLNDAVNLLRGPEDTQVRITVLRNTTEMEFKLKRQIIKVESVAYALLPKNIGYVRVKAFQGNTADDVKKAILSMKKEAGGKVGGVILDLRDNPGGLLREAVAISDLFLDGGEVVSTQGPHKESRQVEMASGGQLDDKLKIAVLVNGGSASASEIVASAIKYGGSGNGRGIVVGERTFGKGSVQMLFDIPTFEGKEAPKANGKDAIVEPAALKLTIAQYFGPKDTPVQETGVMPDIALMQVRAEKAQDLSLFENTSMREVDLDSHLAGAKPREEKAILKLDYLAPKASEETAEYSKIDIKALGDDFAVKVASAFIASAKGATREQLLENATKIGKVLSTEEERKIVAALKKHGIDWTKGNGALNKDALKFSVVENKIATAGEKLKISVKVKNTSKLPIHQVYGITSSKTPLFDQRELLFGKVMPGKEITRTIEFEIPQDVISRKDTMKIEFKDAGKVINNSIDLPLEIKGLERPQFAHMIYVDDSKKGNGDGIVQKDENVELVAWIKNIGKGKAFEPTILLRNESGSKVFLKTGREQGKELLPNQESSVRFTFSVKEPTDKAEFEIQIFDGKFRDVWRDKIVIDVKEKTKTDHPSVNKVVEVTKKEAELYILPDTNSQVVARLSPHVPFKAIKEVGEFYAIVAGDNMVGYVKKAAVVDSKLELDKHKGQGFAVNYDRVPASVQLKFAEGKGFSLSNSGIVHATITNAKKVAEALLFVNGQKVLYRSLPRTNTVEKIEHKVNLKPGVNIITLLANEDSTFGQRENITVFFDEKGKLWPEAPPVKSLPLPTTP